MPFKINAYLYWIAANFTVFNIGLPAGRRIEQHGYLLPAIRALKKVFQHSFGILRQPKDYGSYAKIKKLGIIKNPSLNPVLNVNIKQLSRKLQQL